MKNIADNKYAKFGEISSRQSRANLVQQKCVETRRRVCIRCDAPLTGQRTKFCSNVCRNRQHSYNWRVLNKLIKRPGVGSGRAQGFGKKHHSYKTGILNFSKRAFNYYEHICKNCKAKKNLLVHHKNCDRTNNSLRNLVVLCKKCHQAIHCKRDPVTGRYIKG